MEDNETDLKTICSTMAGGGLMHFKGNTIYFNNLTVSLFSLAFIIYGLCRTEKFVRFYKLKFYVVFMFHYYALILNSAHALILQHNFLNATVVTELCMFLTFLCLFCGTMFWTYAYYLKYIYSIITRCHFKTFVRLMRAFAFWKPKHRDYYDYETLNADTNGDVEEEKPFTEEDNKDELTENTWFRFFNYQILGNYLFTQVFNIHALTSTFLIRTLALTFDMSASSQLTFLTLCEVVFVLMCCYFDFRYRKFTKSLTMPHLTLLVLEGSWMFEHYQRFDKRKPEPLSLCMFIFLFMYIVIRFAFLTESSTIERIKKRD